MDHFNRTIIGLESQRILVVYSLREIEIISRKNILNHTKPFLLIALILFITINTTYSQSSVNQYSDNAKDIAQSHSNTGLSVIVPSADKVIDIERKQYHCRNYAKKAVDQNDENIKLKCGFTGLRWNNDQAGQEKWCLGVLDIVSERESRIRAEKLTACHIQATSSDNPKNQLKLPPNCYDPKKEYTPVKSVYAAYRYQRSVTQVVENGLIQYDYNKDGKKDYVYIEQK